MSWPYIDIDARAQNYERENHGAPKYECENHGEPKYEREKPRSAKIQRRGDAIAKARNLRPKTERESASAAKNSARKHKSASSKTEIARAQLCNLQSRINYMKTFQTFN
jgi:hypothetical protein